jgi:hypothetical protein
MAAYAKSLLWLRETHRARAIGGLVTENKAPGQVQAPRRLNGMSGGRT